MADLNINSIKMPTLREIPENMVKKVDHEFKFTLLSQIDESQLQEKLTQMIKEITVQGKKIAEHRDIRELKSYRGLISNFFNEVMATSHQFSRENFLDRRGRHRVYGIIRMVNDKVDALARELLRSEKDQVKILDCIGEIQGLILDILT